LDRLPGTIIATAVLNFYDIPRYERNEEGMERISPEILKKMYCPHCIAEFGGRLDEDAPELVFYNDYWLIAPLCGRKYPIIDGIPIMMVEEGQKWMRTKIEDLPLPPSLA
jgi:uncharacterized protein YbaR (Trm112 family)